MADLLLLRDHRAPGDGKDGACLSLELGALSSAAQAKETTSASVALWSHRTCLPSAITPYLERLAPPGRCRWRVASDVRAQRVRIREHQLQGPPDCLIPSRFIS